LRNQDTWTYGSRIQYNPPCSPYGPTDLGNDIYHRKTVTSSAIVKGNFKDPNPWQYTVNDTYHFVGVSEWWMQSGAGCWGWGHRDGVFDGEVNLPTFDTALAYNRALENLNAQVRGRLDLGLDLIEARQTANMIRGVANVVNFARHPSRWSTLDIANGWLQFQYGWRPLLQDIYDACDDTQRQLRNRLTKVTGKCTIPIRVNGKVTKMLSYANHPVVQNGSGKVSCHITVELALRDQGNLAQWSSLNPVSLAWEVIPYSFVVDWFIDVGSFLRNLETGLLFGSYFRKGYVSTLSVYAGNEVAQNNSNGYVAGGTRWRAGSEPKAKRRYVSFNRSVLTSYPLPRTPTFHVGLGSQRLFSAAALLRQLLGR